MQRWRHRESGTGDAMNRQLLSSCLLAIIFLSQTDRGWSQTAGTPSLVHLETQSPTHIPVTLPIRLFWNYLVIVEGSIGNVQKLRFLVDTGAYPSVVDQKIAHDLALVEQPARVNLSNTTVQARLVTLPSLLLGPVRVEALPVLTQDLSFLRKALGYKVDAIIGLDILRKSSFTINYRTKEMLLGSAESLAFSAPFDTDVPLVTIRTRFENLQLRLVVDTGSPDVMLFESRMPDSAGLQTLGVQKTANASGTLQLKKVWIPEMYLGQETIGAQAAVVVDDHKDDGDNFDGILGMKGPQFSKIAFDFEQRRFSWELPVVAPALTMTTNWRK
jgi:predicted aspartyl protease